MSKFFKRNYVDVLQVITPSYYKGLDKEAAVDSTDLVAQVLTTELNIIKNNFFIQPLSSTPLSLSGLLDFSASKGYSVNLPNYLIKQNKLTEITFSEFDLVIMKPLGYEIDNYDTSAEFKAFLSGTLLPQIAIGVDATVTDIFTTTKGAYGTDNETSHKYLLESLGLFHILNYKRTATTPNLDFQSLLVDLLATKLYSGYSIGLVDAIKILKTGFWNCTDATTKAIAFPSPFASGTDIWTSGTQSLNKIKTWADIMYTEAYGSESDTYVRDSIVDFVDNDYYPDDLLPGGPFYRLQRAAGFLISDINDQIVSLETLHSIEDCPVDLLPYLADIIGWEFYTSNTDAWRRQLRSAISLYKQKGTRLGLENLIKVVLPSFNLDFSSQYNEFYESYVPNLMYYLLKTDSYLFSGLDSWTQDKADSISNGERDGVSLDNSIRLVIDNLLLDAVEKYPHLFNLESYRFDLTDPSFSFNFRNRDFKIPPWEHEKFYKDCAISEDVVEFFKNKLKCLGVTASSTVAFYDYVLDNTIRGMQDGKFYNNGFFFLTSSMNLAPNYSVLLNNYDRDSFDLIPLWNGKSSHFDLSLSSTNIDNDFFNPGAFDREDFFASLEAIPKFVPAKAIPRTHIDLLKGDPYISFVALSPRATVSFLDQPNASGVMGGFQLCSVDMRSAKAGLLASSLLPGFDDSKSRTTHANLPAFKRDRLRFGIIQDQIATNYILSGYPLTLSGDYIPCIGRSSKRRRDNSKTLWKGDWFDREGFNPPIRLNIGSASGGTGVRESLDWGVSGFIPLGFVLSSYSFVPVTNTFNLPGVYESCETLDSCGVFNGVDTSNTFAIRGTSSIEAYEGHTYRYRDDIEDFPKLIYDLIGLKIHHKTLKFLDINKHLFQFNDWRDFYGNVYNTFWNSYDLTKDEFYNKKFGKYYRRGSRSSIKGIPYLYENFFAKESFNQNTAYTLLNSYINGGSNILSKINGPYMWNGLLTLDGSGVGTTKTNSKNTDISDTNEFLLSAIGLHSISASSTTDLYVRKPEYRNPYYFSGVEVVYNQDTKNKMMAFSLSDNGNILDEDSALLENNLLGLRIVDPGSRLRFSFNYGDQGVFFSPEHDFKVDTKSIFMDDTNLITGGRSYGVWIHTEVEQDEYGNNVFWNYSPNGKWEIYNASEVTSANGYENLINKFLHNITHPLSSIEQSQNSCFADIESLSKLWNLEKNHLVTDSIKFSTNNQPIAVPLNYYRVHHQVHREDQKYVIELVPYADISENKIWLLDGLSVVDTTLKDYSRLEINESIDDYSLESIITTKPVRFFTESMEELPLSTLIFVDANGNMSYNNSKITAAISLSKYTGAPVAVPTLFTQINASSQNAFYSNGNIKPFQQYVGWLKQEGYNNNFSISSIYIRGKTRGSNIKYNFTEYKDLEPYQILEIMSFYKNQAITAQKRANQGDTSEFDAGPNGFDGGGRLNYRDIVVQGNWSNATLLLTQRYTEISIIN